MSKRIKLYIDSSTGGNGDIWMRLVSFYSIASLYPEVEIGILIPKFLRNLARFTFSDRLVILNNEQQNLLSYTSLGIKDLIKGIVAGKRYLAPYQKAVIHDKKQANFKDNINSIIFDIANVIGVVQVPNKKHIELYQGYLDIIGIKRLKNLKYSDYSAQLQKDFTIISTKLKAGIPTSPELSVPNDLGESVLVYPTGTSRQYIPVWWAKQHLPNAYFSFFYKDKENELFEKAGLRTLKFYHEPGDIIKFSQEAFYTISTDSFPSHLLQSATHNCTITITEVLKSRIISPGFKGKVVDAQAACHPCLHLDRTNHPLCAAGYSECINWKNSRYTEQVLNTIPQLVFVKEE